MMKIETFGGYGFKNFNMVNTLIGRPFFYADEETGIGWESKIDNIWIKENHFGYILELSCGTRVDIDGIELMKDNYRAFTTNLKEDNG
jgi:hypothetical protein